MNAQNILHICMGSFQILAISLLYFFNFIVWITVHEIYYENRFLKMLQTISKVTLSYWKESDKTIFRLGFSPSEKCCYKYWWMIVIFEWTLSNFLKLFKICSLRSFLKILLVSHHGIFYVQRYQNKSTCV